MSGSVLSCCDTQWLVVRAALGGVASRWQSEGTAAWVLAVSPARVLLTSVGRGLGLLDAAADEVWTEGRVFSRQGEIRWRRLGPSEFRVVYLGEPSVLEVLRSTAGAGVEDATTELAGLSTREQSVFLWGRREPGQRQWFEAQIPEPIDYEPSSGESGGVRMRLVIEEWLDRAGRLTFARYAELRS